MKKVLIFIGCFYIIGFSKESVILKRNIFTKPLPPSPPKQVPSILKPAPLPSLDSLIEIVGIAYFPDNNSLVIIKDKRTGNETLCKEGDIIYDAKIIKISKEKVYFEYDNKQVYLNLENKAGEGGFIVSKELISSDDKNKINVVSQKIPEEVISMDVDFEKTITELINDKNLIQNLNLTPNINEGKIDGFKVSNLPENSVPYQYGLRNGDIVRRVNGILVDSIATGFSIYNQIKNSNTNIVTVEVLRDNKPLLLTFRLNRQIK